MRFLHSDSNSVKGWFAGPWESDLSISVGYANTGIDEPHRHTRVTEIYLVARGRTDIRVEHQTLTLQAGDCLIIIPGEAHTFLSSSADYFHFVIHTPGLPGDEARDEKQNVPESELGV